MAPLFSEFSNKSWTRWLAFRVTLERSNNPGLVLRCQPALYLLLPKTLKHKTCLQCVQTWNSLKMSNAKMYVIRIKSWHSQTETNDKLGMHISALSYFLFIKWQWNMQQCKSIYGEEKANLNLILQAITTAHYLKKGTNVISDLGTSGTILKPLIPFYKCILHCIF